MFTAVRFAEYGGVDVLRLVEVESGPLAPDRVRVRVVAASINPGEAAIRSGAFHAVLPARFPEGQGSDFAGVVVEVGCGVIGRAVGDEVIGFSDERSAHAELVDVPAANVIARPIGVPWDVAATLYVAGTTAWAAVEAVQVGPGDTIVVSAAAGGVGGIAAQLAVRAGAKVIGTASEANHAFLRELGVLPVSYGPGLEQRIREAAPDGVDAYVDAFGDGNVDIALALEVPVSRIDTIVDFRAVREHGVLFRGNAAGGGATTMATLAAMVERGELVIPIIARYALSDIRAAYSRLETRHGRGKIVLIVDPERFSLGVDGFGG